MRFDFLNRGEELERLSRLSTSPEGALGVLYGRRRCGKSRLLREALRERRRVFYVGDEREAALQRTDLAREIGRLIPGFAEVDYPEWEPLLSRWWRDAVPGAVLVLDELPSLVAAASELPSMLQKCLDRWPERGLHLLVSGSSQRMMQGLVLDRSAPLFGRAREILRVDPLLAGWLPPEVGGNDPIDRVEAYAAWGGVPRYWELAADYESTREARHALMLSALGALFDEPYRLLADEMREARQASSILALVGRGCHRVSELAGRLGKPASSLSRPMKNLEDLGLLGREQPYGTPARSSKRSRYLITDPFLRQWFRFVEPNRSRLVARLESQVRQDVDASWSHHVASVWEDLARLSVPRLELADRQWRPAVRWWGPGRNRKPMEIDVVSESLEGDSVLVGEVKWQHEVDIDRELAILQRKADQLPLAVGREIVLMLWLKRGADANGSSSGVVGPSRVLDALR